MGSAVFHLWASLLFLAHLANGSPIVGLEDVPVLDEEELFFDEQDTRLQDFQNEFLKVLNLSEVPLQDASKVEPPEYMLELYNRFATDKSSMPLANIVRSFKNEGGFWNLLSKPGRTKDSLQQTLLFS